MGFALLGRVSSDAGNHKTRKSCAVFSGLALISCGRRGLNWNMPTFSMLTAVASSDQLLNCARLHLLPPASV